MKRVLGWLSKRSAKDTAADLRAIDVKIDALQTGADRMVVEAEATREAADELLHLMREDWKRRT